MTSLTFDIYLRSTPERVWAVLTDPGKGSRAGLADAAVKPEEPGGDRGATGVPRQRLKDARDNDILA